jgi:hypothetical protein
MPELGWHDRRRWDLNVEACPFAIDVWRVTQPGVYAAFGRPVGRTGLP